jgi:hypothetical protein
MAVLVEGISVLVRTSAIHDRYPGGWAAFTAKALNRTLCSDNELVRFGFMAPADCASFIGDLERVGILHLEDGKSRDIVVADQLRGFTSPCEWAEFGSIEMKPNQRVSAAQLKGTAKKQLFCPDGWSYEGSLSQHFGFIPTGQQDKSLKLLRREYGIEVYFNTLTDEAVYIGRTNPPNNG